MSDDSSRKPDESFVLETPPSVEAAPSALRLGSGPELGPLFGDDSLAQLSSKSVALESLLSICTQDLSFNDFVRETLMIIMKVVRSEAGSVLEFDHANQCYFFRSTVGTVSDRITLFTVPAGKGIVGHVGESRLPLLVDNVPENELHLKTITNALGFEVRNLIALPLVIRGRLYGVVELLNRVGEETYSPADTELLTYLCEAAAKAIEIRMMIAWRQVTEEEAKTNTNQEAA